MINVNCIECGKTFEAQRSSAKFCGSNCRVKWNNKPENKMIEEEVKTSENVPVTEPAVVVEIDKNGAKEVPMEFNTTEKTRRLREVIAKCEKDFGAGSVMFLGEKPNIAVEVISTGSLALDEALGVGGLPRGRIVEIFGPESSGKTTIAIHVIAQAQKMGLQCMLIDAEHAFDPEYATNLGVKIDQLLVSQPDYGEQGLEIADRHITSGQVDVMVIDSVAALTPKGELEGEMGDSKMGLHARLMSQACRKMTGTVSKTNCLLIFIYQLRNKIGVVYGNPEVTTGGMALQFYASIRLDVRRSATLKDGDEAFGNRVKVKVVKNKVAPPFKFAEFDILFGQGIDYVGEVIDVAVEKNIIAKAGSWYSFDGSKLGQGRESVRGMLKDNPELLEKIEKQLNK
jgi:recombination protein RecA